MTETTPKAAGRRPVFLSTDCGVDMDDQWAIVHLSLIPEIDLRGIVTSHAPNLPAPAAQESARIAGTVLDTLALPDRPPVLAGSDVPLAGRTPLPNAGVDLLIQQARGFGPDDRLPVLVLGAATDVASALLTEPTVGDAIEVIAMAFDGWPEGKDGFNVRNDVTAWQVILESSAEVVCGDAASTIRHLSLTVAQADALLGGPSVGDFGVGGPGVGPSDAGPGVEGPGAGLGVGGPGVSGPGVGGSGALRRYLVELLDDWLVRNGWMAKDVTGDPASWPVWDEVVVAYLLGMTEWTTHPRPALRSLPNGPAFDHTDAPLGGRTVRWITSIDQARLWQDLRCRVTAHDQQRLPSP